MGCGESLMKCFLYIVNGLFVVCGFGLIGVGAWLKADKDAWNYLHVAASSTNSQLVQVALWIMIGVGVFIALVALLGFIGTFRTSDCMLNAYAALVGLILLTQFAAGILVVVFRNQVESALKEHIIEEVLHEYTVTKSGGDKTIIVKAIDYMQVKLDCCGSEGYKDWDGSKFYNESENYVPESCCKLSNNNPEDPKAENYTACNAEAMNMVNSTTANQLHVQGCYDSLWQWVHDKAVILMGVGFGIIVVEILAIVFACCLKQKNTK